MGDTVVAITLLIGFMCLAYFGIEDGDSGDETRAHIHVIAGFLLVGVLGLKIAVLRWWHSMGRYLPLFGLTVFTLFLVTWLTSSGDYLAGGR